MIALQILGSCRFGITFGFNDTTSILFSLITVVMLSTDVYYLLLAIFTSDVARMRSIFHILFYGFMSLLALIACVFSIVGLIFCVQQRYNSLCTYRSCGILSIGVALTFLLTIMYSLSSKLICCVRGQSREWHIWFMTARDTHLVLCELELIAFSASITVESTVLSPAGNRNVRALVGRWVVDQLCRINSQQVDPLLDHCWGVHRVSTM